MTGAKILFLLNRHMYIIYLVLNTIFYQWIGANDAVRPSACSHSMLADLESLGVRSDSGLTISHNSAEGKCLDYQNYAPSSHFNSASGVRRTALTKRLNTPAEVVK